MHHDVTLDSQEGPTKTVKKNLLIYFKTASSTSPCAPAALFVNSLSSVLSYVYATVCAIHFTTHRDYGGFQFVIIWNITAVNMCAQGFGHMVSFLRVNTKSAITRSYGSVHLTLEETSKIFSRIVSLHISINHM